MFQIFRLRLPYGRRCRPAPVPKPYFYSIPLRYHQMPYFVEAYADNCKLTAKVRTAKKAFAKAIDWRIVGPISAVTIRDGRKRYSIG